MASYPADEPGCTNSAHVGRTADLYRLLHERVLGPAVTSTARHVEPGRSSRTTSAWRHALGAKTARSICGPERCRWMSKKPPVSPHAEAGQCLSLTTGLPVSTPCTIRDA